MMINVMGIININEESNLGDLTHFRSVVSVPIAGRYRIIDFPLSNLANAGIRNVGIMTQVRCRSLMDHVRSRKEWDLDRKQDGLFILSPYHDMYPFKMYKGDLENYHANIDYLLRSKEKHVIIIGGNLIYNIDLKGAFEAHLKSGADISIVYKEEKSDPIRFPHSKMLDIEDDGRIFDIEINPEKTDKDKMSLEIYIMERSLLVDIVNSCISRGEYDFVRDGIIKNLNKMVIKGQRFEGFMAKITTIMNYFLFNMDLLNSNVWEDLFFNYGLIYTKVKDEAPAKYFEECDVTNSLVANGCIIEGKVENSILFRGVRVHRGAHLKNCIIMQKCDIEEDVHLEHVIIDKDGRITKGKKMMGDINYPLVVTKKTVV